MKVYIWGKSNQSDELTTKVRLVLEELGLTDFVSVDQTDSSEMKQELEITQESALIIEEETINFKDMIFEGIIPEPEELKSMFISIIGGSFGGGCGSKDENGSCGTGCSC